jgi:hypothetical protein
VYLLWTNFPYLVLHAVRPLAWCLISVFSWTNAVCRRPVTTEMNGYQDASATFSREQHEDHSSRSRFSQLFSGRIHAHASLEATLWRPGADDVVQQDVIYRLRQLQLRHPSILTNEMTREIEVSIAQGQISDGRVPSLVSHLRSRLHGACADYGGMESSFGGGSSSGGVGGSW